MSTFSTELNSDMTLFTKFAGLLIFWPDKVCIYGLFKETEATLIFMYLWSQDLLWLHTVPVTCSSVFHGTILICHLELGLLLLMTCWVT